MMKRIIKYSLLLTIITICATSCKVWQDEWTECKPLPETEIPVNPDPWEPGDTQENETGK